MSKTTTARIRMRAAAATVLLAVITGSGCATKKDISMLRDEVIALQARQDSTMLRMERQYRLLFDTLRTAQMAQLDQAGQTSHRFRQLEESLDRTQQMLTDLQVLVSDLRAALDQQRAAQRAVTPYGTAPQQGPPPVGSNEAQQMLNSAQQQMQQGSIATARIGFQQILEQYGNDPVAPDAQYFLAMTYEREGDHDKAIDELGKVWKDWPRAPRAAQAMLQAAIIAEEEQNNRELARELYRELGTRFAGTPEAAEAARRAGGRH